MCIEINHTIYDGPSAVCFMHKPRAFKIEPVNTLEKAGTENVNIHKDNNKKK